jgi:NAD(P)-dependent dehydrogenase (short-subunit alcohol dehydrogenase family)
MLEEPWQTNPEIKDSVLSQVPMRRFGKPEEIAGAMLWLCSDEASYMTGREMIIGGGQTLRA